MDEVHMLTRLWKWKFEYYKVHANHKMSQQCWKILFPPSSFFLLRVDEKQRRWFFSLKRRRWILKARKKHNEWRAFMNNQKMPTFSLSLVKSFKDFKWYDYLQATSTNAPSIGTPSHWCARRQQYSISRSHRNYFTWQGCYQKNHETTSSIAKSFVGQENKIKLNHKGKK